MRTKLATIKVLKAAKELQQRNGYFTQKEIRRITKIPQPTVTVIVKRMIDKGLVEFLREERSTNGGRPLKLYALKNPDTVIDFIRKKKLPKFDDLVETKTRCFHIQLESDALSILSSISSEIGVPRSEIVRAAIWGYIAYIMQKLPPNVSANILRIDKEKNGNEETTVH